VDGLVWALLAAVVLLTLMRLRHTRRKTRVQADKQEQIRRKLEELRRKKDEDNGM
jgi:hypothetical protein